MQTTIASVTRPTAVPPAQSETSTDPNSGQWASYNIIRRNGSVVGFEPSKIAIAMTKAFLAVNGGQGAASARVRELVEQLTAQAVSALVRNRPAGGTFHIEDVQDQVELALMRSGEHDVARAYVLYRERRAQERAAAAEVLEKSSPAAAQEPTLSVVDNGVRRPLDLAALRATIEAAGEGLTQYTDTEAILKETVKNLYDGVPVDEVFKSAILPRARWSKGSGLQPGHRPPAAAHDPQGSAGRGSVAGRHGYPLRGILPCLHPARHRRRPARRQAGRIRPGARGQGAGRPPRPAIRLPGPADPVRPLLPARARHAHRAAAGVLHARGHGPGAARSRPRSARHRVL